MNVIEEFIGRTALKKVLRRFEMENFLKGKRTYVTAGAGIVVVLVGLLFGNTQIGPVTVPAIDVNEAAKYIWEALMIIFLRKGIAGN